MDAIGQTTFGDGEGMGSEGAVAPFFAINLQNNLLDGSSFIDRGFDFDLNIIFDDNTI